MHGGNCYIAFDVTANNKLRPFERENEPLHDYTENYVLYRDISKNIAENDSCICRDPVHQICATKLVKKRKTKVVASITGPRIPDLHKITNESMKKYSKVALLLFKPHRSRGNILQQFNSFADAFNEFQSSDQYKDSQGGRIHSNTQQYYVGKRRVQEIRTENLGNWSLGNQADSESECSDK